MKRHQKHENKKQAFTLVELIIVIVILSILATIGFISFQNYSGNARDGNRLSTIKNIQTGLELYVMKTGKYPTPEGEVQTGTLGGGDFAYKGEIQTGISRQIGLNKAPQDPETKNNYTYSTTKTQTQYEIGSVLEGDIAYTRIVPTIYALGEYKAKVEGNYIGYAKYKNNDEDCISYANIPSIIWSNTGSVNLLSTGSESQETPLYVINNEKNLPYFQEKQTEKILPDEVIQRKTKKENAKIITICEDALEEIGDKLEEEIIPEEKEIIESFGKISPKEIKETILGDTIPVTYASCEGISHGVKKMFYKSSSVPYGNTCEAGVEFECRNGEWKHSSSNKIDYPSEVECVEGTPKRCEIGTTNDGYSLGEPLEHGSGSTLTKEDVSFENGEKILSQEFHCDNGDLVKRETPETGEITKCNIDYYANNNLCEGVGVGYYSPDESIAKIECDNKKGNSIYTTSGSGANACEYSCETGYEGSNCSPKGKTMTSGVYNGRTFSFTSFTLLYGTPQTKTSSPLSIPGGTSTLTATFSLGTNGTDVTLSAQSENIVCSAGFSLVGSNCNAKEKTVTSAVYNTRTFSFTSFTLLYGTPQTKTSSPLSIPGGTSTLTATFTLGSNGTDVTLSAQSESVVCSAGYYKNGSDCSTQWSGNATTGYVFTNTSGTLEYPTSCNNLLTSATWKNTLIGSPWNGSTFLNGVYFIKPDAGTAFKVYCDMINNGGGWTRTHVLRYVNLNTSYATSQNYTGHIVNTADKMWNISIDGADNSYFRPLKRMNDYTTWVWLTDTQYANITSVTASASNKSNGRKVDLQNYIDYWYNGPTLSGERPDYIVNAGAISGGTSYTITKGSCALSQPYHVKGWRNGANYGGELLVSHNNGGTCTWNQPPSIPFQFSNPGSGFPGMAISGIAIDSANADQTRWHSLWVK